MATLRDVSRQSGYSVTTVSRALNGFPDVTEATRRRIEAVARALDYRPNRAARSLVTGRSGMVALVLAAPPAPFEHAHFFAIIAGTSREFSARDLDFVLHVGTGAEDPLATYDRLIGRGSLDGFILTEPDVADPRIRLLLERGVPFVVHGRDPAQDGYASYDADNAGIAAMAVDHVAALGHRRIALLNGPAGRAYAAARQRGFSAALARHGLPPEAALLRHGDTSARYGREAAAALLAAADPPTAILCCNVPVALGVLEAARAAGRAVPGALSVVAHDDRLPPADAAAADPPLTTTLLPLGDAAAPLADLLLRRLAGEPVETLRVEVPATFVRRGSTAPAR